MDFFEAVAARHSYRDTYTDAPVPREDLIKIVEAGAAAPSGKNAQTTKFVVIDDPALLAQIAQWVERPTSCATAKAAIAVVSKPENVFLGRSFHVEDYSAAVENMLLAISALGYASVWVQGYLLVDETAQKINKLLRIPEGESIEVLLPVGVPAKKGHNPPKKPLEERMWFNRHE
ncbi:MAG: nitroreductase family protein [Planctomycetia bacterium]|nr:nitroreductase family protein [Planctomycetia bacterium]